MKTFKLMLLVGLLPGIAAAYDDRVFEKTVAADASGEVVISNVSGSIEVRGWDRKEVRVRGQLGRSVERVDVEPSGNRVLVKVVLPRGNNHRGSAELEVWVPKASTVDVSAVSADVDSDDVTGTQRLKSVSGEVTAEISGNESEVRSVSGNITVQASGRSQNLRVSTVSGDIEVTGAAGKIDVVTVSGDARVDMGDASEVRGRSTSGSVSLRARLMANARVEMESVSGDVSIRAGSANGHAGEIESFSGDIHGCLANGVERVSKYGPGTRLTLRGGDSAPRLRVKTLSGNIEICDR